MALLTPDMQKEIQEIIQEIVNNACAKAVVTSQRLTPKQAIDYIGIINSVNSLKKLVTQGLTKHQLNGKTYYLRNEIDEFIHKNDIPSNIE